MYKTLLIENKEFSTLILFLELNTNKKNQMSKGFFLFFFSNSLYKSLIGFMYKTWLVENKEFGNLILYVGVEYIELCSHENWLSYVAHLDAWQ